MSSLASIFKTPSEMELVLRYKLFTLFTLSTSEKNVAPLFKNSIAINRSSRSIFLMTLAPYLPCWVFLSSLVLSFCPTSFLTIWVHLNPFDVISVCLSFCLLVILLFCLLSRMPRCLYTCIYFRIVIVRLLVLKFLPALSQQLQNTKSSQNLSKKSHKCRSKSIK